MRQDWIGREFRRQATPREWRNARIWGALFLAALLVLLRTAACGPGGLHSASPEGARGSTPTDTSQALTAAHSALPENPFARCATKALRGDYGELAEWQRKGYQRGLCNGAQKTRCWVTTYFPEEGNHRGDTTASGWGCSERVASANLLPMWTWVWTPQTGIRQVMDRGARSNDAVAQRRYGAELWIDFWEPREGSLFGDENGGARSVWIIRRDER